MDFENIQNQKFILKIVFNDIKFKIVVDNHSIKIEDFKKLIFKKLKTLTPNNLIPEQYIITNNSGIEFSPSDILSNLVQNNDILQIIQKMTQQQDKMEEEIQEQKQQQFQNQQIQSDPQEAIVVLINCSQQMENLFSNDDKITRQEAAYIFFLIYLDKLISFKLNHVVKLICFSDIIEQQNDYTKNFNSLQNIKIETKPVTQNRLIDAIQLSVGNLSQLRKQKYPNIKLRIIAFTDGDDNSSQFKPEYVIKNIIQNQIVLDSLIVGENCTVLKNMSHASGGLCFHPSTLEKGLQLFEQENILSISLRQKFLKSKLDYNNNNFDLNNVNTQFDSEEQEIMRQDDLQKDTISNQQMINKIENDQQLQEQCKTQELEEEKQEQQQQFQNLQINQDPLEAIVILINCSQYMIKRFSNEDKINRKEAVFILFSVYLDKLISFKLNHVVKLICFSNIIKQKVDYTKNFNSLQNVKIAMKPVTQNRLNDAIHLSVTNLSQLRQQKYPNIKLRIIALTDGDDNSSVFKPEYVIKNIIQNQVVLDSFIVGENSTVLKNMSHASGGLCFHPTTLIEGIKLFENENIISISLRHKYLNSKLDNNYDLNNVNTLFDSEEIEIMRPDDIQKPTISIQQMINKIENDQQLQEQCQKSNEKRVLKELQDILKNPCQEIQISLVENDMFFWKLTIFGPDKSPYAGGVFQLYVKIPTDYPNKPPKINFVTKIYHCNITKNGSICMNILNDKWCPTLSIYQVILSISSLLTDPNPDDLIETEIALIFKYDRPRYEQIAQEWTKKYAI